MDMIKKMQAMYDELEAWKGALAEIVGEEDPDILKPSMLEDLVEAKDQP